MKDSDSKAKTLTPAARKVWASRLGQRVMTAALNKQKPTDLDLSLLRKQMKKT